MTAQQPILVVEDEADGQELVARMLAIVNMTVEIASDGEQGWEMLQQTDYGAAIIDLGLPGIDGIELVRMIRADSRLATLPCIAVTAFHTPELKQQAVNEGFNYYFAKPLDRTLLLNALDRAMA